MKTTVRNNYNIYQILQNKIVREFHTSKDIIIYVKNILGLEYDDNFFTFMDSFEDEDDEDVIVEFDSRYIHKNFILNDQSIINVMDADYELSKIFLDYWVGGAMGVQRFKNKIVEACELGSLFGGYHWEYIERRNQNENNN